LRKAAEFYRDEVSTEGGYHFQYAADLSFGRSEQAEGPTQITVQRSGTPLVGMAFLEAYETTGDRFYLEAAEAAAMALVGGQQCSGGWAYIVEFDPEKRAAHAYRADGGCEAGEDSGRQGYTTLDDNVTQAALRLLMRVDRALGFEQAAIHEAAQFALETLIEAQYANGAWPQRFERSPNPAEHQPKSASYPETWPREWPGEGYREHYTFNDSSIADVIDALLEAARIYDEPRYLEAAKRGGEFILLAQMPEPQPAWAQQYNSEMHPVWARLFEPPSISGSESQSVMRVLLALYRETGDRKFLEPLPRAIEYLKRSALPEDPDAPPRRRRTCPPGSRCLARFYELRTNKPLFITKGTQVRVAGQSTYRPDGYEISYDDDSTIQHYAMWRNGDGIDEIEAELDRLKAADPGTIRRPDKLHGLSPWQRSRGREATDPKELAEQAAEIVAAMDERGAWEQDGVAGRADRVVNVFAAEPMAVRIGGRMIPLAEDQTLEVFRGEAPPVERMISSATFARSIEALAAYVGANQQ